MGNFSTVPMKANTMRKIASEYFNITEAVPSFVHFCWNALELFSLLTASIFSLLILQTFYFLNGWTIFSRAISFIQ